MGIGAPILEVGFQAIEGFLPEFAGLRPEGESFKKIVVSGEGEGNSHSAGCEFGEPPLQSLALQGSHGALQESGFCLVPAFCLCYDVFVVDAVDLIGDFLPR